MEADLQVLHDMSAKLNDIGYHLGQEIHPIPPQLAATMISEAHIIIAYLTLRIDFSLISAPPPGPPFALRLARLAALRERLDRIKHEAENREQEV